MTTTATSSQSARSTLVAELRRRLEGETFPRFIVLFMLLAAGAAAFLSSVLALSAGMESMAPRYGLATAGGYLVFLLLIRVWIAVRRGWTPDANVDGVEDCLELAGRPDGPTGSRPADSLVDAASDGFAWSFDADDLGWLVLVAVAALAGLVAVAFVVYAAPVLLAEVALDAALVGGVYRRLRREDRGYWATTALRRTWAAAAVLVAFMAGLGFALQQVAPEAVSIGDVVRRGLAR